LMIDTAGYMKGWQNKVYSFQQKAFELRESAAMLLCIGRNEEACKKGIL
jgi:hypothetical protein